MAWTKARFSRFRLVDLMVISEAVRCPPRIIFQFILFLTDLLGSLTDEILLGNEKTTTVIDGSGVIHDPHGLELVELRRLAKARKMISNFDKSKLSKDGYVVLCEDQDLKLPCKSCPSYGVRFDTN